MHSGNPTPIDQDGKVMAEFTDAEAARLNDAIIRVAVLESRMTDLKEDMAALVAGQSKTRDKIDEVLAEVRNGNGQDNGNGTGQAPSADEVASALVSRIPWKSVIAVLGGLVAIFAGTDAVVQ